MLVEGGWEILENSPVIIDRYREATISYGYSGDSLLNSLFDIIWMMAGFLFAAWDKVKAWWVVALALIAPAMIVAAVMRRRVRIEDGVLHVVAGLNQTRVPLSELAPDDARIVDLETHPELRPGIKTFGTAMPGYQAGHFRQVGGGKVFALVTDRRKVLALRENGGRLLLLSLAQPYALLDALSRHPRA